MRQDTKELEGNVEKKLKNEKEYKKLKDTHKITGTGRKNWRFYEAMDSVIGHKQAVKPPVVLDTSEDITCDDDYQETDIDDNLLDDVDSSDINVASVVSNDDSTTVTNELSSSASTTPPPTVKGLSDVIPKLDNKE